MNAQELANAIAAEAQALSDHYRYSRIKDACARIISLSAEIPALAPSIIERRSGNERRQKDDPDMSPRFGGRSGQRRGGRPKQYPTTPVVGHLTVTSVAPPNFEPPQTYNLIILVESPAFPDTEGMVYRRILGSRTVTFVSDTPSVATVGASAVSDAFGLATVVVTAVAGGTANITATCEGVSVTQAVTVTNPVSAVDHVVVTPSAFNIPDSGSQQLSATVYDAANNVLANKTVTWNSDTPAAATVGADSGDENHTALVSGVAAGSATITATCEGVDGTSACTVTSGSFDELAELPREYVDTTYSLPTGSIYTVKPTGGDYTSLQAALNAAATNTIKVIVVDSGMLFDAFTLPAKVFDDWTYIMSSDVYNGTFPRTATQRVVAADASYMFKVKPNTNGAVAVDFAAGAKKYRIIGMEATCTGSNTVVLINQDDTAGEDIHFDRCYVYGVPGSVQLRRAFRFEGRRMAVLNCRVSGVRDAGNSDSQCIWSLGAKVVKVYNNYLEAAGENIMTGGACTALNQIPEDWWIAKNHFFKPLSWIGVYAVKNLYEMKMGRRFLIEDNVMQNCWTSGQTGYAIVLKSVGQVGCGDAPQYVVEDIVIRWNRVEYCERWLSVSVVQGDSQRPLSRLTVRQNLFINKRPGGTTSTFLGRNDLGPARDIVYKNNVFEDYATYYTWTTDPGGAYTGAAVPYTFEMRDNIMQCGSVSWASGPIGASGQGGGVHNLTKQWQTVVFLNNGIQGKRTSGGYDASNVATNAPWSDAHFVDADNNDYRLQGSSIFKGTGTGGTDPGVDSLTLATRLAGVE